ncbi:MAG: ATP/GTP-binding protein [Pseudomonadota bacterium]
MEHKIIFTGPVGAGKTTAIGTISDIPVVSTEAAATDDTALRKANTTVAMDYGVLHLDGGAKVHLYGTPGQERFSFMWDILTVGGIGLVLLIDNGRDDPLADLEFYLKAFARFIEKNAVVIGITRMDSKPRPGLYSFHTKLAELQVRAPVFEVDARSRDDVRQLLLALLAVLDPGVRR